MQSIGAADDVNAGKVESKAEEMEVDKYSDHKMSASPGGKSQTPSHGGTVKGSKEDDFVRVRKSNLEKLTTEVMQLKEFLPKVLNRDLIETVAKARVAQAVKEQLTQEQEQLRQECLHLQSRLSAAQTECQKEREEKLLLREQLWQSAAELQQQIAFCSRFGSVACSLLWSSSARQSTTTQWLDDVKLQSFFEVAAQTLESFVRSFDEEGKKLIVDTDSQDYQFVLGLAGTITNIAAVPRGREFLSSSSHILMDTLMKLLPMIKSGVFPKLKVLMLMALYNVSISVNGLKYISESPDLLLPIWNLLEDEDWEVCLHSLRLLQSMLIEGDVLPLVGPSLLDPALRNVVSRHTSAVQPCLRLAAEQTLVDLQGFQKAHRSEKNNI